MTYQEAEEKKQKEYQIKLQAALEEFNNMRSSHIIRDEGTIENAKECAKKYKVRFADLLKTKTPGNNFIGQKTWDKQGKIYKLKS
jgi:hypothetical protein